MFGFFLFQIGNKHTDSSFVLTLAQIMSSWEHTGDDKEFGKGSDHHEDWVMKRLGGTRSIFCIRLNTFII
jgi:hypothetical protein